MTGQPIQFPPHGKTRDDILNELGAARQHDVHWKDGKAFSLVYRVDDEVSGILQDAYTMFFSENGLRWHSQSAQTTEVVAMAANLLLLSRSPAR
jgi:glutamate/tyrosine decarboxylase-like PLP-dependent enzyme